MMKHKKTEQDIEFSQDLMSEFEKLAERLLKFQRKNQDTIDVVKKENRYSAKEYQFIKFVERKFIRLPNSISGGRFFYPFEVQILTEEAYQMSLTGEADHINYKKRQLESAKARVLNA